MESLTPTTFSARGRYPTLLNFAAAGELIVKALATSGTPRRAMSETDQNFFGHPRGLGTDRSPDFASYETDVDIRLVASS